jgi:exosortase F-associated protein
MLQKILNHKVRIALALLFVILLALIRVFEDQLFYDPFLNYFKKNYYNLAFPETDNFKLFLGLSFRYFLNTVFSLAIIYVLFKDLEAVKFASVLYGLFFIILILGFFFSLLYLGETNKMALFYVRRFIIQPILLLLFLPALYYQKKEN